MIDLFDNTQVARAQSACTFELSLSFVGLRVQVFANTPEILDYLDDYYASLTQGGTGTSEIRVFLINDTPDTGGAEWTPVKRSKPSPLGLKEAFVDMPSGRWIHKVRTGMVMFQSMTDPIALGDLQHNRAQVVNFINNQFLNHYQREGYLLGHASAFDIGGDTTAIAASSGGGKSTLMLRALENPEARFLSNDRILFRAGDGQTKVLGLAKHPRVNPGTLVNSSRLASVLPECERTRFETMPRNELWEVEQKYDVLIPEIYGEQKTALEGQLKNLILLDWSLESTEPTALSPVDAQSTPEALEGLRKSAGPFFQAEDGHFPQQKCESAETYASNLKGVCVWRLTGSVDFDQAVAQLERQGIL